MIPGRRFTVLRQSDGRFLLEDAHTGERARVEALAGISDQIGRWLQPAPGPVDHTPPATPTVGSHEA